jgi:hypothetical protein
MPATHLHRSAAITALTAAGCLLLAGCADTTGSARQATGATGATGATSGAATATAQPAAAGPAGVTSACTLVTEKDASTALGTASGRGDETTSTHSSQCVYGQGALIVTTDDQGKTEFETQRSALSAAPAGSWHDITGIGDGAFEAHSGPEATVTFYKGEIMVSIILAGSGTQTPTDAAITAARSAVSHL